MGDTVIAVYRPKPGGEQALRGLVMDHVPHLRRLGLATDRPVNLLSGKDGVILEIFEWVPGGVDAAHSHPEVQKLWAEFAKVCDYVPLAGLPEAAELFSHFSAID